MELGEKLRHARLEAGLSQRQLCGEVITRNMLSQIEHGTAKPSMDTLRYLAGRLGKPLSFFLDEDALSSPNSRLMEQARAAFRGGDFAAVQAALDDYKSPDPVFDEEWKLLAVHTLLSLAERALTNGLHPFAKALLERAAEIGGTALYYTPELERRRLLLLGQLPKTGLPELCRQLPSLDEELLLRCAAALEAGELERCLWLLGAAEDQTAPRWNLLRGELALRQGDFSRAAGCYRLAEDAFPETVIPKLELCYRELEDYKLAYLYACKQK